MITLRGQQFAPVWNAAGARGFFGEGRSTSEYWMHRLLRLDYRGSCFVAKTTTLQARPGNMPLTPQLRPQEWKPRCIVVKPVRGVVLNAVGLSGPGAPALLARNQWQRRTEPFLLSFMAVPDPACPGAAADQQLLQSRRFFQLLGMFLPQFQTRPGLQLNFSCPNTDHGPADLVSILDILDEYQQQRLELPLVVKLNALTPLATARAIAQHPACDALTCSNTIPWGQLPEQIDWRGLFNCDQSPLARLGGGGLSGWPLTPIVADWIERARQAGIAKPIVACGGILRRQDVDRMHRVGASGVELGAVSLLRPWRVRGLIRHARRVFGGDRAVA